jgi:hypothetical protein
LSRWNKKNWGKEIKGSRKFKIERRGSWLKFLMGKIWDNSGVVKPLKTKKLDSKSIKLL